jgi:lysozyme
MDDKTMTRRISREGLAHLKRWEGVVLHAYDDFDPPAKRRVIQPGDMVRGTLTIGYGSTGPHVKPGMTISTKQAETLLRMDLDRFEQAVERLVKVPLNDHQHATLVSFAFNVGTGNFQKSTLLRKLNAGDYDAVPSELMRWTRSKGKVMQGLVNRRSSEAGMWSKGAFVASHYVETQPVRPPVSPEAVGGGAAASGALLDAAGNLERLSSISEIIGFAAAALVLVGVGLILFGQARRWREGQA